MTAPAPATAWAIKPENIPQVMRGVPRWVCWQAGPTDPNGKFSKYPVDPLSGRKANALDPTNWLSFDTALAACNAGQATGVGIVLSDQHPIIVDGLPFYLAAVDLDSFVERDAECRALWLQLGQPYLEVSPSGKGLHLFGLCSTPLKGGNAGSGRELYLTRRFMTVTGQCAMGNLRDVSGGLIALEQRWFSRAPRQQHILPAQPIPMISPETLETVQQVLSMLDHVSSDTDYATWRDIIWSVASTGWASVPHIVHQWSKKAALRYDAAELDRLLRDFDASRGLTIGTLAHHARQNGWSGSLSLLAGQTAPPPLPPPLPPPSQPRGLLTFAELKQLPVPPYLVRGVLPAVGVAAIYGEPGSGKSFLALDLAHAISTGRADWFGYPVRQAPVAYVALEGQGGLWKRGDALEKHTGQPISAGLRFWCHEFQLTSTEVAQSIAKEVVETLGSGAIVFIDTLNQASPGLDENASQDMSRVIEGAKRVAAIVGGLVVLVHHAGKARDKGLRGHSSLNAAMDAVIEVTKLAVGCHGWRMAKAKDDVGNFKLDFELVPYQVGQDARGPVTSCAVQQTAHVDPAGKVPVRGSNNNAAIAELRRVLAAPGQAISYPSALQNVAAVLTSAKRPRDRAKEVIAALIRGGHLLLADGGLRLAD